MYRKGIGVFLCGVALFVVGVVCEECTLKVAKLLDNDEDLPEDEWTTVTVEPQNDGDTTVKIETPHYNADIKLYFANDEKNILAVDLTSIKALKYKTPYGEIEGDYLGASVTKANEKGILIITSKIPSHWFPKDVTRMSASVEMGETTIHNYYGIFNKAISIPDTMVVERYKKVKCFQPSSDLETYKTL